MYKNRNRKRCQRGDLMYSQGPIGCRLLPIGYYDLKIEFSHKLIVPIEKDLKVSRGKMKRKRLHYTCYRSTH